MIQTLNGVAPVRLWGVTLHKEKRTPKPDADELAQWGEPFENVVHSFYGVRIALLGKQRHVGTRHLPAKAGELYDSALFHLWGFVKRPRARFNFLKPGQPEPEHFLEVKELRRKLQEECRIRGLDFEAFNYTFFQRNES